jgi:regulation of enolase protein 1 (concanavalin A-like superfamily)
LTASLPVPDFAVRDNIHDNRFARRFMFFRDLVDAALVSRASPPSPMTLARDHHQRRTPMPAFTLPSIPAQLDWTLPPLNWRVEAGSALTIQAGPLTDLFTDPATGSPQDNVPAALFTPPDVNFLLSAKVAVDFAADFDAGTLQLRISPDLWAKLCFEYSPQGEPMVVSVVTRGASDDCNHVVIAGREVHLRIAVTPRTAAFHYSLDGAAWRFVRYFTLGQPAVLRAGFSSQSPRGQGCSATFSDIRYQPGRLSDNRSGE